MQAQSRAGQLPSDATYLNLTVTKLVLQSDVREPPIFRGDGSDKNTVCEWEELMEMYFRKQATSLIEQYSDIMSKLMGKAKDIVRITLRNNPSKKPQENPKIIYDILRQHFEKYNDIFSKHTLDCGEAKGFKHRILLTYDRPFCLPYRQVPPAHYQKLQEIIRKSVSDYASPLVLVWKKMAI